MMMMDKNNLQIGAISSQRSAARRRLLAALAQQGDLVRRIGVLMPYDE
jgi:hypothetical protein